LGGEEKMTSDVIISPKTLIPAGFLFTVIPAIFWIAGLSNKINNQAYAADEMKRQIHDIRSNRTSLEIEIMQEIRSSNISTAEMERKIAVMDTKLNMLIDMIKKGQQ
jgi:hypothetical protein